MFGKSIRLRFQLWLAFLLLAVLGGFGFTAFQLYRTSQLREIDAQLERRIGALNVDVRGGPPRGPGGPAFRMNREHFLNSPEDGPPPEFRKGPPPDRDGRGPGEGFGRREIRLSSRTQALFDESETNGFYFLVWNRTGNLLKQSTNAPANLARPPQPPRSVGAVISQRGDFREAYQFTEIGEAVLVGRSISEYRDASQRFALLLLGAGAGVLFVGLGGGWILTSRALRPIREISETATQISGGDLARRINVDDTDSELGQLANILNATFSRLDAAFAQQKQFTGDAAHELRTPLAVIISETQTALARPRTADEYRETVEACLETAQRMRALTQSLLELARFDAGQEQITREPFDLEEVARTCAKEAESLAREKGVKVSCELESSQVKGDPDRMGQVITNLLTNAIHYNNPGGEVHVTVKAGVLEVADTGIGIPPGALSHIFERFYRVDPSRTRGAGNSGLGLAITKAIVDAHGGTISVQSQPGVGTIFKVTI